MSLARPYIIDDEDKDAPDSSEDELELVDYGEHVLHDAQLFGRRRLPDSEDSELQITGVYARESPSAAPTSSPDAKGRSTTRLRNRPIQLPDTEIPKYRLRKVCTIAVGDTVELQDTRKHEEDLNHSGDFLRVKHIIMNLQTDEVRLRGYRLRRTKYLQQLFEWKLNELAMVIAVQENGTRCPMIAGMEDISVDEVLRLRDCVLTNKPYPLRSFREDLPRDIPVSLSDKEMKQQIFHGGRLVCRLLNILEFKATGTSANPTSGTIRQLYAREADINEKATPSQGPGASRFDCIALDEDDSEGEIEPVLGKKRSRPSSNTPRKRLAPVPTKQGQYTFGDMFCGAGGSSQGALQAGLQVRWGLDADDDAIEAYQSNHMGALPFRCNAHNFPPPGTTVEELRVDVLHLSPPCCYFSPAHTTDGPNDQANLEAIYTVGPTLKKLKPRVATLEQTFGLSSRKQHKANFLMLLNDIRAAGYDVRYRNLNIAEFGLVQPRKRLLIIAARRGTPLPPFPKITHGPPGSGLKPWHFIKDALRPIERLANHPTNDKYHQTKPTRNPREPHSPQMFLKGCITTNGGGDASYHFSGLRKYTPRELSLFQSFPPSYRFTGGQGDAIKQIGNAFPPIMAEVLYRTIAKTLEAFDKGFIEAEDDLSDLDELLEKKGAVLQNAQSKPRASFNSPRRARNTTCTPSRFAQAGGASRPQQSRNRNSSFHDMNLLDGLFDGSQDSDSDVVETTEPLSPRIRRPATVIMNVSQHVIEVSSGSEDDYDGESSDTVYQDTSQHL